jgi:hypothetical protein
MTPRERVRLAFAHQEPDRVPVYEQTVCSRVASEIMGRPMLTGGGGIRFGETAARWESDEAGEEYAARILDDVGDMVAALDFDIVGVPWRFAAKPSAKLDDFTFRYEDRALNTWSVFRYAPETDVFDEVDSSLRYEGIPAIERIVAAMVKRSEGAGPPSPEAYAPLRRVAARAGGTRAWKSGEGSIAVPRGEAWWEACALRPDLIEAYLEALLHDELQAIPMAAQMGVQVLWAGGDLASAKGPFYSPAMFRRLVLPRLQQITRLAHAHGLVYLFRTDGDVWSIADDLLVNSGVDGFGEIDIEAGMELPKLKRAFPRLTLWGGVACGRMLTFGSPEEVREEARRVLELCKPGGGLIFGSSNSILSGLPTANFLALQAAASEFGVY